MDFKFLSWFQSAALWKECLFAAILILIGIEVAFILWSRKKVNYAIDLSALWKFLQSALSEDNGHASSFRVNQMLANLAWIPIVGWGFVIVCLYYKELIIGYLVALLAAMGLTQYLKTRQKDKEENVDSDAAGKTTQPAAPNEKVS
jgi:hypothetical protein